MNCDDMQDLIHAYMDGELDLVRNLEIEKHIRDCQGCLREYKNYKALRSAMSSDSLYFKPPLDLKRRIQSAVRKGVGIAETMPRMAPWRWLSIAASLALVTVVIWALVPVPTSPFGDDPLTQEIISGHVRSLMADHLTDVPSSDQHTVKPWFNGKLDFSPPVKDLANNGFPLIGGRLDYIGNKPVAVLVYNRRKHFINLFIWPSIRGSDKGEKTVTRQGYNLIHWAKSGMTYWAVSDLNNRELQEFVQAVQS